MPNRYSKDDLRKIAELVNSEAGRTIVTEIEFNSPGNSGTWVTINFDKAPHATFKGKAAAAHALHAIRYAFMAQRGL